MLFSPQKKDIFSFIRKKSFSPNQIEGVVFSPHSQGRDPEPDDLDFEFDEDIDIEAISNQEQVMFSMDTVDNSISKNNAEESESEEMEEEEEIFSQYLPRSEPLRVSTGQSTTTHSSSKSLIDLIDDAAYRSIIYLDNNNSTKKQIKQYRLHSYNLKEKLNLIFLVPVNDQSKKNPDKYLQNIQIQEENRKINEIYQSLDEKINSNQIYYFEKQCKNQWKQFLRKHMLLCPGLVHFVIIRRSDDVIFTPDISSLSGSLFEDEERKLQIKELLEKHVKKLFIYSQDALINGYHTMLMAKKRFKYFYHVWLDNDDHNSFMENIDQIFINPISVQNRHSTRLNSDWYKKNIRSKYGDTVFEFYGLFVRETSNPCIVSSTKKLVSDFFDFLGGESENYDSDSVGSNRSV